jgi:hypothetical protein
VNKEIKEKAQAAHIDALKRLVLAMCTDYEQLTKGRTGSYFQSLHTMALALLGSPFCRVTHRKWSDEARAWLLSLY